MKIHMLFSALFSKYQKYNLAFNNNPIFALFCPFDLGKMMAKQLLPITADDARRRRRPLPAELVVELVDWLPMVWFTGSRRRQLMPGGHIREPRAPATIGKHPLFVRARDKFIRVAEEQILKMAEQVKEWLEECENELGELQQAEESAQNVQRKQELLGFRKILLEKAEQALTETTTMTESSSASEELTEAPGGSTACTPVERHAAEGVRKFKLIMLGEAGVGKTSIVHSFKYGPGLDGLVFSLGATIGASHTNFDITVRNNVPVRLELWDTAGQERFRCMVPIYKRNASGAILVYDITNRASFEEVDRWHAEIARRPTSSMGGEPVLVLIANKADQHDERGVAEAGGEAKAQRLNAMFYEISAINPDVIRAIFKSIAEQLLSCLAKGKSSGERVWNRNSRRRSVWVGA